MDLSFNDYDFGLMREAVSLYLERLRDTMPRRNEDIALVEITARKLRHYRKAVPVLSGSDYSVLVTALRELRAEAEDILDFVSPADADRAIALKTQKDCNRLLRDLRRALDGIQA